MSPVAHLLASWLVGAVTTDNARDRKLVTLAGIVPDVDGLGILADLGASVATGEPAGYHFYHQYHHLLMHGWPAAAAVSLFLAGFARRRWRVLALCLLTFHLHLLCDLLGSRGPTLADVWPICYGEPVSRHPIWIWRGQWKLDGWQNFSIFVGLLGLSLGLAVRRGYSFVELFSRKVDAVFVGVLRKWCAAAGFGPAAD